MCYELMAFAVTTDHARQEQIWEALQRCYSQEPYQIRRLLTEGTIRPSDQCALFVGLDAHEAAGGVAMRELFQQDDGGWLENVALLDTPVAEKLKVEAEKIAAQGWKRIEVDVDFPYEHTRHLRELEGTPADLTAEEQATFGAPHGALKAEYAKLDSCQPSAASRLRPRQDRLRGQACRFGRDGGGRRGTRRQDCHSGRPSCRAV